MTKGTDLHYLQRLDSDKDTKQQNPRIERNSSTASRPPCLL